MEFTKMTAGVSNISALPDRPSPDNGYDAAAIKHCFDKAGEDLKTFLNSGLIGELESISPSESGADRIGSTPIQGLDGENVRAQLISMKNHIDDALADAQIGVLPDGSLTAEKLSDSLIDSLTSGGKLGVSIYKTAGEYTFTAPKNGFYRLRLLGAGGNGTLRNNRQISGTVECSGGSSGNYIECFVYLKRNSCATVTVGAGGTFGATCEVNDNVSWSEYDTNEDVYKLSSGGATSFGSDEIGFTVICPGGSSDGAERGSITESNYEDNTLFGYVKENLLIEKRGDSVRFDIAVSGISESCDGADSQFGCGGNYQSAVLPANGAGGAGGRTDNILNKYIVKRLPQRGGDGLAIIEYIALE